MSASSVFLFEFVNTHLSALTDESQAQGFDIHLFIVNGREYLAAIDTVL